MAGSFTRFLGSFVRSIEKATQNCFQNTSMSSTKTTVWWGSWQLLFFVAPGDVHRCTIYTCFGCRYHVAKEIWFAVLQSVFPVIPNTSNLSPNKQNLEQQNPSPSYFFTIFCPQPFVFLLTLPTRFFLTSFNSQISAGAPPPHLLVGRVPRLPWPRVLLLRAPAGTYKGRPGRPGFGSCCWYHFWDIFLVSDYLMDLINRVSFDPKKQKAVWFLLSTIRKWGFDSIKQRRDLSIKGWNLTISKTEGFLVEDGHQSCHLCGRCIVLLAEVQVDICQE